MEAFQWLLFRSAEVIADRHGFPKATFCEVVHRLWFDYVPRLQERVPFSIVQYFVVNNDKATHTKLVSSVVGGGSGLPQDPAGTFQVSPEPSEAPSMPTKRPKRSSGVDAPAADSGDTMGALESRGQSASGKRPGSSVKRSAKRTAMKRRLVAVGREALHESAEASPATWDTARARSAEGEDRASDDGSSSDQDDFGDDVEASIGVPGFTSGGFLAGGFPEGGFPADRFPRSRIASPTMPLVLGMLLASARQARLPLFAADLLRAAR
jgi:hypothetical protein